MGKTQMTMDEVLQALDGKLTAPEDCKFYLIPTRFYSDGGFCRVPASRATDLGIAVEFNKTTGQKGSAVVFIEKRQLDKARDYGPAMLILMVQTEINCLARNIKIRIGKNPRSGRETNGTKTPKQERRKW